MMRCSLDDRGALRFVGIPQGLSLVFSYVAIVSHGASNALVRQIVGVFP